MIRSALLASVLTGFVCLVVGAAAQRWGDGEQATEHHTRG